MDKTKGSIGQYKLLNYGTKAVLGKVEESAEIWKGNKQIASVYGITSGLQGWVEYVTKDKNVQEEVLRDMQELLYMCETDVDAKGKKWGATASGAVLGFVELLVGLNQMIYQENISRCLYPNAPLVLLQTGSSKFDKFALERETRIMSTNVAGVPKANWLDEAKKRLREEGRTREVQAKLIRYVESQSVWTLSFVQYAAMVKNAREVNKKADQ